MNPQLYKIIFKGHLEFGNQRTFDMVVKHWQTRVETYFKADILFKSEQVFDVEEFALRVPSQSMMSTEKHWRATTSLLQEVAQYAIACNIRAWRIHNGQVLDALLIEPRSDKAAVAEYKRGCELVREGGRENEASEALSRAIEKYERHAAAYERRGYVNYKLKNFNDALYDFSKSIAINPNNPDPHYGCGKVKMMKNDWDGAAQDFEQAIKLSLALQPIHWLARQKKGDCLLHAKKFAEAATELKRFLERSFAKDDPNFARRPHAWISLGKALLGLKDVNSALDAFLQARVAGQEAELQPAEKHLLDRIASPDFASKLQAAVREDAAAALRLLEA